MSRRGYCRIVRLQNKLEIGVPSMVNHPDDHLSVPEETAVQEFVASFWGELIRPVDDGYDAARAVYNGMIDKRPALIVRPTGTADVIDAVNLERENRLRLALAEVGAGVRQPDLGRRRDRRWQAGNGKRGGERRPLLGHPRRQRQLRGGEFLRVPPPPFGSDRAGRLGPPPDR